MTTDRWVDKIDAVHISDGILLSLKRNEIMPFVATWTDLHIVIYSEVRQISYALAYVWNLKKWYKWTYLQNGKSKKQTYSYQGGKERRDKLGDWDWYIHTNYIKCAWLLSHVWLFVTLWYPARLLCPWEFLGKNTEWVAISSSQWSSPPRDGTHNSWVSWFGRQILCH